ncbi:MAG: DUF3244 domain-containing protein [Bacteroidales bacterium]|nr:DUF3244 domain-containing protein [Bacteroidales bacterium]
MKRLVIILFVMLHFGLVLGAKEYSSREGIDVLAVKEGIINGSEPRSEAISADITGHTLTITFNDNVGIAHIVIKDSNGVYIDRENVFSTPDHATFIIDDAGYYRMDITLSNGEQYYGYFRVEN